MKTSPRLPLAAAIFCSAFALILTPATASAAEKKAKTKQHTGTYSNSKDKTGTFDKTTTKQKGVRNSETNWTNQNGGTGNRTTQQTWDKETKTGTHAATTTLPNGKTATTQGTVKKNEDGSFSNDATRTGFNGQTQTINTTTTKTENGRTTTGTITNPDGKTATINTTASHANGQANKNTVVTGEGGKTREKTVSTTKNPDGTTTRVIEVTGPDGITETRTETFTTTP
jgi:hypothetical protein